MTVNVSSTEPRPSHHISLEIEGGATKYGLILHPTARSIQRRPRQVSEYTPFSQADFSGGRGIYNAKDDNSRFGDSNRMTTRHKGMAMLAGLETYTTGYRQVEQFMPSDNTLGVTWQALIGNNRFVDYMVTASASGNRYKIYFKVRRRGTPNGPIVARLKSDNAGNPGTELQLKSVTTSDIDDTLSLTYEFTLSAAQAVSNGVAYWVEAAGATGDDATNHWEVGVDAARTQAKTKASPTGADGSWANTTYDLYFRLVDDRLDTDGALFFMYKSQIYMVERRASTIPKLYMLSYRGVATGTGQTTSTLKDTTQTGWAANELTGALLLIIDGKNSEITEPYRRITGNTTGGVINYSPAFPNAPVAGAGVTDRTAYVVLGGNKWVEITGHGLTVMPTSVCSTGEMVYFAQGDRVKMRRMRELDIGGVWTREFATEDNYAKLLMTRNHEKDGVMVVKANDYDNTASPSVAQAKAEPWGTNLTFPKLITRGETLSEWTASTGVGMINAFGMKAYAVVFSVGPTAPNLIAYCSFTAAQSLKKYKQLRILLSTDAGWEAGELKIRLSSATDCSTTIEELIVPAMPPSEFVRVTLKFQNANANIWQVKTIGLVKTTKSGTIYVGDMELLGEEVEVQLGNDMERFTGLELFGDPETVYVFRTGSAGSIEDGVYKPLPLREYRQVENVHNGLGHCVMDVYLFFSFLHGIEMFYRNNLDDVGMNKDEGLPANRQGYVTSMIGYPDRMFANYDAGVNPFQAGYTTSRLSSIFEGGPDNWHEIFRSSARGKRVHNLFHQVIPGPMADRLWFVEGDDICWLPLPGNTLREDTDLAFLFTEEGALETGWIGGDDPALFYSLRLFTENLAAGRTIEWDYKLDENTAWTPVTTAFTTGPVQTIVMGTMGVNGKRIKLRFRPQTNNKNETPVIRKLTLEIHTQPTVRFTYSMTFAYMDNGVDALGLVENYTRAETLLNQLDTWAAAKTPLTMKSVWSPFDNKTVIIDHVVTNPETVVVNEQIEKLTATLVAYEP